jgi:hypothetical protein
MIEVHTNLFVGNQDDELSIKDQEGWYIIHACKEPYHRQALGYTGRGAPKDHPEYLIARRPGRLILNLVDVDDVKYIDPKIIDAALVAIHSHRFTHKVLIHCNQGLSRSPSIALLYLHQHFQITLEDFRQIYPNYAPAKGMADYVSQHWDQQ